MSLYKNESSVAAVTRILTQEHGIPPNNLLVMKLIEAVREATPPPREVTIGMLTKILQSLDPAKAVEDWANRSSREVVAILSRHPAVQRVAALVDDERLWCELEGTIAGILLRVCQGQDLEPLDAEDGAPAEPPSTPIPG